MAESLRRQVAEFEWIQDPLNRIEYPVTFMSVASDKPAIQPSRSVHGTHPTWYLMVRISVVAKICFKLNSNPLGFGAFSFAPISHDLG